MSTKLWYRKAATEWKEGLPIGTGRLAAMVLGGPEEERVALNHEWLWRGRHRFRDTEKRSHLLPEVRELLIQGDYVEGTQKGNEAFGGPGGTSGKPRQVDPYQPAGDLRFRLDHGHGPVRNYRRELDLTTGAVTITYDAGEARFRRVYLAHLVHDLILIGISSDGPFSGTFWLDRVYDPECDLSSISSADTIVMEGRIHGGIDFRVQAAVLASGGSVQPDGDRLRVTDAEEVRVVVDMGTSARGGSPAEECARRSLPEAEWDCDYHHDVNLQMNYWPAEAANLQESTGALFDHLERFVPHARKAARDLYDCDGILFPLQTDAWGRATPESFGWAVWIGAAPWLAQHLWWHYEYGQDLEFLKNRAYPFLKEVAAFYESYLVEDGDGRLQIVPSQSPENRFVGGGDLPCMLCVSSAVDIELARDLLDHTVKASELLGADEGSRSRADEAGYRRADFSVFGSGPTLQGRRL